MQPELWEKRGLAKYLPMEVILWSKSELLKQMGRERIL